MWKRKTVEKYRDTVKMNVLYLFNYRNDQFLKILEGKCCIECQDFIECIEGKLEKACEKT